MDQVQTEEKYKATKLWNDAIRAFRNQMPLKQHRKNFKLFADTFTGTEAIDWLHGYLSAKSSGNADYLERTKRITNGLAKVTREQTLALLNKFYDHGLFEPIRPKLQEKSIDASKRVKDDGTLYKFTDLTPSKIARTPLALKQKSGGDSEKNKTPSKKTTVNRRSGHSVTPISYRKLQDSISKTRDAENVVDVDETNGKTFGKRTLMDNLLAIDDDGGNDQFAPESKTLEKPALSSAFSSRQNSIRQKINNLKLEPETSIPQLQLITRWLSPEEVASVWKAVAVSSLRQLLRLDETSFTASSFIAGRDISHNSKEFTARGVTKVLSKSDELPSWTLQAMKCLANWPWKNSELNWPCYPGFERDVFATVLDFFATQPTPLIPRELQELLLDVLSRVEYLDVQQWDANNEEIMQSPPLMPRLDLETRPTAVADDDLSIETEFGACSPISRLVERMQPFSRASIASVATTRQEEVLANLRSELEANVRSLEEILSTLPGLVKSPRLLQELRELRTRNLARQIGREPSQTSLTPTSREIANSYGNGKVLPLFLQLPGARFSVASAMTGSLECSGSPTPISQSSNCSYLSFFTRSGRQVACSAFQICLLFLSPKSRRWLQLLLRMMSKICVNYCLRLDKRNASSNRSILLDAFCDVLINGNRENNAGDPNMRQQKMKLVSFLLDTVHEVFAPPLQLISSVENRICQMQRGKISYASSDQNSGPLSVQTSIDQVAYCERISPKEYEQQATFSSRHALRQLLDSIADDKNLSGGDKKKRLKRFKDSYPDLFYQRFPSKASFESLIKSSNSSLNKDSEKVARGGPFGRLVSIKF